MKKNNFLSGVGTKLGLAVMALAGSLLSSCEKEDFNATFEPEAAKAEITVAVYDGATGQNVTSECTITPNEGEKSVVNGNTIVTVKGNKSITAHDVTVGISYNGLTGTGSVSLPNVAEGTVYNTSITFIVRDRSIVVGGKPEDPEKDDTPAKVVITASAEGDDVNPSDVTYTFTGGEGEANGNTYTITGNLEIAKTTVTVEATINGEKRSTNVEVEATAAGQTRNYSVIFNVKKIAAVYDPAEVVIVASSEIEGIAYKFEGEGGKTNDAGDTYTIVGTDENPDIAATTVKVIATAEGIDGNMEAVVDVPETKAGTVRTYSVKFFKGKPAEVEPIIESAKAVIYATSTFEGYEGTPDVKYTFDSTIEGGVANDNTYTIVGDKAIAAQTVTVTATVDGKTYTQNVNVPDLEGGMNANFYVAFHFIKGADIPGDDTTTTTSYVVTEEVLPVGDPVKYYLTGTFNHTHSGIDQWIANDSEWLITAKVTYGYYVGYEYGNENIIESSDFVTNLVEPLKLNSGIEKIEKSESFTVSAWCIYAAWAEVTTTVTKYTVKKVVTETVNGEAKPAVETVVATYTITRKDVKFDHTETAHPSHSHAYSLGHGHAHGHGGENAGGGIVWAD